MDINSVANSLYTSGLIYLSVSALAFSVSLITFLICIVSWIVISVKEINGKEYGYRSTDNLSGLTLISLFALVITGVLFAAIVDSQSDNVFAPKEAARNLIIKRQNEQKLENFKKTLDKTN
jgi:hypothetical protein